MLNHIVLMGRLTRDPELRRTQSGTAVASFTLAVDRDFSSQGGEKQTDFIDIVAWRNTAEFVSKYFAKGQMAEKAASAAPLKLSLTVSISANPSGTETALPAQTWDLAVMIPNIRLLFQVLILLSLTMTTEIFRSNHHLFKI